LEVYSIGLKISAAARTSCSAFVVHFSSCAAGAGS